MWTGYTLLYDKNNNFNFHVAFFPFLSRNIQSSPTCSIFVSQHIRYARACSECYDGFIIRARQQATYLTAIWLIIHLHQSDILFSYIHSYGHRDSHVIWQVFMTFHDGCSRQPDTLSQFVFICFFFVGFATVPIGIPMNDFSTILCFNLFWRYSVISVAKVMTVQYSNCALSQPLM